MTYKFVEWTHPEVQAQGASIRFVIDVTSRLVERSNFRSIARVLLPADVRPTAANVRDHLFLLRTKHNFRSMTAGPKDELLCLMVAAGLQEFICVQYVWSCHETWWTCVRSAAGKK